jgi:hypothetical protein
MDIGKIKELSSGDEDEQRLAQEMMGRIVREGFPLDTSDLVVDKIYDLICVEGNQDGLAVTELSDVWMGFCFARVTIVTMNGANCVPVMAEESENEMNNAYRAVSNLASRIIAQSKNARP